MDRDAIVQGQNITVSLTATNAGMGAASKVVVKTQKPTLNGQTETSWKQMNDEATEQEFQTLDVGESRTMKYVYNVETSGEYVVEAVGIAYFASETREVTKGESNVVKAVKVLTPVEDYVRKVLQVTAFLSIGALSTTEDWKMFARWIFGIAAVLFVNHLLVKVRRGVQSLRRMSAVRGLEGEDKID